MSLSTLWPPVNQMTTMTNTMVARTATASIASRFACRCSITSMGTTG